MSAQLTKRPDSSERLEKFIANPRKAIWTLAVPVMMGMAVQTLYSVVDMLFVGRISALAIAALGFNVPLFWLAMGISFGLGTGVTAVIARFMGARDQAAAENVAEHGIILGFVFGVPFSLIGLIFARPLLSALGAPDNLIDDASAYFRIISGGFMFMIMSIFLRSILSGEGDTKTPMKIQITATILNIILDPIFIFTFGLGVSGAALATVISMVVTVILYVYVILVKKGTVLQLNMRSFKLRMSYYRDIFRIGLPASISMIIMAGGAMLYNFILISYGAEVVAGYQVAGRLDQVFFLPVMAIAGSLVTLVGMFYGAQRIDLIRQVIRDGLRYGISIGIFTGILFWFAAPYVLRIFSDDPIVLGVAVSVVRTFSWVYWLIAVGMLSGRALQGLGTGIPSMVITAVRVALVGGPLGYYFAIVMGKPYVWVWYGSLVAVFTAGAMALTWLRYRLRLTEQQFENMASLPPAAAPLSNS